MGRASQALIDCGRKGLSTLHNFTYPRAEFDESSAAIVKNTILRRSCRSAETFDTYRIPRIAIRRSDGWRFFRAKLRSWLEAEEAFYAWLHTRAGRKRAQILQSKFKVPI